MSVCRLALLSLSVMLAARPASACLMNAHLNFDDIK
jgi:hypothetical protein